MKKLLIFYIAAATMAYAACNNTHHASTSTHNTQVAADTAMGGDAMKKDSTRP